MTFNYGILTNHIYHFHCGLNPTQYKHICILALTTLKTAT